MRKLITILMVFALIGLQAQDVVRNGGFEESDHLQYWMVAANPSGASVEATNNEYHSGNWSAQFNTGTTPIGDFTWLTQDLYAVQNDKNYRLSFWVKGTLSANNTFGVIGIKNGDHPLGIDAANSGTHQTAQSGMIKLTTTEFSGWTEIVYYWYSGNFQNYDDYQLKIQQGADGTNHTSFLDDFASPQGSVSIEEITEMINVSILYPNPAKSKTSINYLLLSRTPVTIQVYSLDGKAALQVLDQIMEAGEHRTDIDVSGLEEGVYLLKIASGTEIHTKKLVITN